MLTQVALAIFASSPLASMQIQDSSSIAPMVKLSGYVQGRETYQKNVGLTASVNRARLAAAGAVTPSLTWRIQGEFRTGNAGTGRASVSLQDAYIRWSRNSLGIQLGQFKTPFTREFVTSLTEIETADRSTVVDSLAPKRDIGVMIDYAIRRRASISVGIFNGEGQNVTANTDSSTLAVTRVTLRPTSFLLLGANAARYFQDSTRYGADVSIVSPWVIVRGEYVAQHRDQLDGNDEGWYALAAVPVDSWLQPVLKYETFERSGAISEAGKNRAYTAGVNFFPWGRTTRLTLEYVSRRVGDPGVRRSLGLAQAQIIF